MKDGEIPQSVHQRYVDTLRWDWVGPHTRKSARVFSHERLSAMIVAIVAIVIFWDTRKSWGGFSHGKSSTMTVIFLNLLHMKLVGYIDGEVSSTHWSKRRWLPVWSYALGSPFISGYVHRRSNRILCEHLTVRREV